LIKYQEVFHIRQISTNDCIRRQQCPIPRKVFRKVANDNYPLANLTPDENMRYDYRFTAKTSGNITGIQIFFVANTGRTGYPAGDGGKYSIKLVKDNGFDTLDETQVLSEVIWDPSDIKPIVDDRMLKNDKFET
jgi:hypothetical protein